MTDEELHKAARETAAELLDPNKKQLRFNEIVAVARTHYPNDLLGGVIELTRSCDRLRRIERGKEFDVIDNEIYDEKQPMWRSLRDQFAWMATAPDQQLPATEGIMA